MNQSGKVALGGIVTALCMVLMFLTGLIPIGTYALPAMAGALLVVIVIELGAKWAWLVFVAVSLLSVFFAADKEAAVLFVGFFGYFPILKSSLERIPKRTFQIILKMAVFNLAMVCSFFIAVRVMQIPQDSFSIFGLYLPFVLLILGNIIFLIYDYALSGIISLYIFRFHPIVKRTMHL